MDRKGRDREKTDHVFSTISTCLGMGRKLYMKYKNEVFKMDKSNKYLKVLKYLKYHISRQCKSTTGAAYINACVTGGWVFQMLLCSLGTMHKIRALPRNRKRTKKSRNIAGSG